jgi:gliding motility-associated-like protein
MIKKIFTILSLLFVITRVDAQNDFFAEDSTVFCVGYNISFVFEHNTSDSIILYNWDFGDSSTLMTTDTIAVHSFDSAGTYTITLITVDTAGNHDTIIKPEYIIIRDTLNYDFIVDSLNLPSYTFFFVATDTVGEFSWTVDNLLFNDTTYRFFYKFNNEGEHSVILHQKLGYDCVVDISKKIDVINELKAPNVFTPNGDGINDYFEPKVNGVDDYTLSIFNRYGEIVFEITCKRPVWDGRTPDGVELNNGIYYYILKNNQDEGKILTGFVYLFR